MGSTLIAAARANHLSWRHAMSDADIAFRDRILMGLSPREYVRSLLTPWDLAYGVILAIGIPCIVYRFTQGLAAATNLSQTTPWGIWIGIDMLGGIALAAGGFTIASAVYLLGIEKY